MANEITEKGQFATYGGPQLNLAGSDLAGKVDSILTRAGSGTARGWRVFDPTSPFNSYTVLNPGDVVLVNPKTLPMDFPIQAGGSGSISWPIFSESGSGPTTEIDGFMDVSQSYLPSFSFSSGSGTLQMQLDNSGSWVAAGLVTIGKTAQFRIVHSAPFSGILTATATA